MEHFKIKFFAKPGTRIELGDAIPVFHRWIQQSLLPEHTLFDVSDYQHVPAGPGILLVTNEALITLDETGNRLGVTYNRRTVLPGSDTDRVRQAVGAALQVAHLLEQEPVFKGKLAFEAGEAEISINDRMLAPNTDETFAAVEPAITEVFDSLWGPDRYELHREGGARELFRVRAVNDRKVDVWQLVEVLAAR